MMEVRAEKPEDIEAVRQVHVAAFGRADEADLVDRLRGLPSTLSWVAVQSGLIVGHVFFSPVTIRADSREALSANLTVGQTAENPENALMLGLAPVAVLPGYQRQGIGAKLIQQGLKECDRLGCIAVVVLGDPAYYARFGFAPAHNWGLRCEYDVPQDAFMVLEIEKGALEGCDGTAQWGTVKYRSEFNELE